MIEYFTDSNEESWMNSDKPLFILFYDATQPNTKNVQEIFVNFDNKFAGKIKVLFCDYRANPKISRKFSMNVLPGVLFTKKGKVYGNVAGPVSFTVYEDIIKKAIIAMMAEKNPK